MFKAVNNLREEKGFTLIELLIVVAIIGILAAIAIPGYIGMQERGRRGAITRACAAAEPELQAWLMAAGRSGTAYEVDTNGDGTITDADLTNSQLAATLGTANGLCSAYIGARWIVNSEYSPWFPAESLWMADTENNAGSGKITCAQAADTRAITIVAWDREKKNQLYRKVISAD